MSWFFNRKPKEEPRPSNAVPAIPAVAVESRARQTKPSDKMIFAGIGVPTIPRRSFHKINMDKFDATKYTAPQLLDVLADVSGEVSVALWNTLRLGAVGWKFEVRNPSKTRVLTRATARLNEFFDNQVNPLYGGFPSIIRQMFFSTYLQGAHCVELEVADGLTDVVDLHVVQPWTIEFERDANHRYIMMQQTPSMLEAKILNPNLVWYIPLDPAIDDPYGRSPATPVIWPLMFDLQFIRDLKQAVHVAGWGRIDVSIIQEVALQNAPLDIKADASKLKEWINQIVTDTQTVFNSLRSDDTFIHTDSLKLETLNPAAGERGIVDPLSKLLEVRLTRALKQLPVLMGGVTGETETQGTIQYEIYTNGLQAIRDIVGFTLSHASERVLQVWGIQGKVLWEWNSIRTKDRLREAQAEQMEIINAVWKRTQGWITNDEAGEPITGKPTAVGDPEVNSSPGPVNEMPNSVPYQRAAQDPSPTDGDPGRPTEPTSSNGKQPANI